MIMTSGFAILISVLFVTLGKYLLVVFTTDQNVIDLAMRMIIYIMPWYLLYVPVEVYGGSLRGASAIRLCRSSLRLSVSASRALCGYTPLCRCITTSPLSPWLILSHGG